MGRAGDAQVVVTNRLLALPDQLLVVEIQPAGDEPAQVAFDTGSGRYPGLRIPA
jgi:hypothetical protein